MKVEHSGSSSDAEELEASIADPRRFATIAERHLPEIFRYLKRRVGDTAEDLASETFLVAFKRRSSYDLTHPNARPWLYGIATNVLRHHRRSEMRQIAAYSRTLHLMGHDEQFGWVSEETSIIDRVDASVSVEKLASAFSRLHDDQRDALYLVGVAGLTYQEAAEALGLNLGTLNSRVTRARAALRGLLALDGQQLDDSRIPSSARERRHT